MNKFLKKACSILFYFVLFMYVAYNAVFYYQYGWHVKPVNDIEKAFDDAVGWLFNVVVLIWLLTSLGDDKKIKRLEAEKAENDEHIELLLDTVIEQAECMERLNKRLSENYASFKEGNSIVERHINRIEILDRVNELQRQSIEKWKSDYGALNVAHDLTCQAIDAYKAKQPDLKKENSDLKTRLKVAEARIDKLINS